MGDATTGGSAGAGRLGRPWQASLRERVLLNIYTAFTPPNTLSSLTRGSIIVSYGLQEIVSVHLIKFRIPAESVSAGIFSSVDFVSKRFSSLFDSPKSVAQEMRDRSGDVDMKGY